MKKIIFFLFLVLPFVGFAQTTTVLNDNNPFELPIDSITGKITFVKIIEVKGKSKSEIYSNVKNWITENYKSPKDVINIDDKESGIILLKSFFLNTQTIAISNGTINIKANYYFSLKINIKDSKYKITITDLEQQGLSEFTSSGYTGGKSPLERAVLINIKDENYDKVYDIRKKMADVIKKEMNGIISSIEHYNTDF